jgi:hypothetical protein
MESVEKLNVNGIPIHDPVDIANNFNEFFVAVG